MKFKKPDAPKTQWSAQMVQEKLETVEFDIKQLQRDLNETQADLNVIFQRRYAIQHSISKKSIYKGQLLQQLKEAKIKEDGEWNEV